MKRWQDAVRDTCIYTSAAKIWPPYFEYLEDCHDFSWPDWLNQYVGYSYDKNVFKTENCPMLCRHNAHWLRFQRTVDMGIIFFKFAQNAYDNEC